MSEGKEERAAGVMDENTKDEGKEDLAREEDGGNILDDILNTKEEKFEDEDMVKKDEEEDDDNDLDLGDEDSPGGREENSRKGPESDFSDSEDEESKAILRDGRDSEMSFKVGNFSILFKHPLTLLLFRRSPESILGRNPVERRRLVSRRSATMRRGRMRKMAEQKMRPMWRRKV